MEDILYFVAIGFAAQIVDGAIGMAYGIVSSTVLLSLGVPPATASASVHAAEFFVSGASGFSHWRLGNVDKAVFKRLVLGGMVGGAIGAYALASLPGDAIRPFVSAYLLIMGVVIIYKAIRKKAFAANLPHRLPPLGLVGGFLDAIGGGGWGPMVTSTLVSWGVEPRRAIGTSNAVEFFVTAVVSAMFFLTIGLDLWPVIVGLVVGGVIAAPVAAYAAKYVPAKALMIAVGVVVIGLSAREIYRAVF